MFAGINNSKEIIRNRMLKHALNYWNIKNTEDLDPVVKLMLEALSAELYNLGNEIKDTEVRLLEKIANLLAPEFLTCPNAAHGVLHASPAEPVELLPDTTHFYTQRKIASGQDENTASNVDIFFTPAGNTRLFDTRISHLVTGTSMFEIDQAFSKQLIAQTSRGKSIDHNVCWLGLEINEKITDLNDLYFYFDWKNTDPKLSQIIYQLLPLGKWFLGGKEIAIITGLTFTSNVSDTATELNLFADHNLLTLMEKDIRQFYHHKYITIEDEKLKNINESDKETFPAPFKNYFSETDLKKISGKRLWLKIQFPAALQSDSLEDLFVYTNAFPVMNRQLNDLKYRLRGGSNIVPLKTSGLEQFLAVKSLSDESHSYRSTPYRKMEEEATGTYTLRHGGVERFDERNAKELISYLLELLRSETAAFSAYGYDFVASTLREINQRIAVIEQRTKGLGGNAGEIPHYIIVKPFEGQDMMYTEYWTTLAENGNMLRSGSKMQQYRGTIVKADSVVLLSTTTGGNNRLKPEERLNAFRYGLITRNRIITKEDIRNLCFYELGDRIKKVSIQKGFEMSQLPNQAFFRTIDVVISPMPGEKLDKEAWQVLLDQLKTKLQARSGMSNNYRVLLDA